MFGVFRTPVHPLEEVKTGGRYLALERVQDPGNVGTLLRSAAAEVKPRSRCLPLLRLTATGSARAA